MPTEIFKTTRTPSPDRLSAEFYWLLGVLLLGVATLAALMHMPSELIEMLAGNPGL